MRVTHMSFEAVEKAAKIGPIRSVEISHERRMLIIVHDDIPERRSEGAHIEQGKKSFVGADDIS